MLTDGRAQARSVLALAVHTASWLRDEEADILPDSPPSLNRSGGLRFAY
jgi:hypothetical protein